MLYLQPDSLDLMIITKMYWKLAEAKKSQCQKLSMNPSNMSGVIPESYFGRGEGSYLGQNQPFGTPFVNQIIPSEHRILRTSWPPDESQGQTGQTAGRTAGALSFQNGNRALTL